MRGIHILLRACPRSTAQRTLFTTSRTFSTARTRSRPSSFFGHFRPLFKPPPVPRRTTLLLSAATALTPAAFIELSQEEKDDGKTGEEHMLEASRQELAEAVPEYLQGSRTIRRAIWRFIDAWIFEPIATGVRFVHLMFIFVPVIVTVPMIWVGKRQEDRDDERWGTVWWYGFLVRSMERAGAAFIKV